MKKNIRVLSAVFVMSMGLVFMTACSKDETEKEGNIQESSSKIEESESDTTAEKFSFVDNVGNVEDDKVKKVEDAFDSIYKKMYTDGLTGEKDKFITLNKDSIAVDITFSNETKDLTLYWDAETKVYTFAIDMDCWYIPNTGEKINGIDPAEYNKELTLTLLGLISADAQGLYEKIDATLYSAFTLSDSEWTEVGDCMLMDGGTSVENAYSYKIKVK